MRVRIRNHKEKRLIRLCDEFAAVLRRLLDIAAVTAGGLMIVKWMDSTKGQNLARRLIALSIVSVWLFQFLSMNILSVAAVWADSPGKLLESAQVIGTFAKTLNSPIMLILAFYFSAPYMGDIAKGVLNKFGERK